MGEIPSVFLHSPAQTPLWKVPLRGDSWNSWKERRDGTVPLYRCRLLEVLTDCQCATWYRLTFRTKFRHRSGGTGLSWGLSTQVAAVQVWNDGDPGTSIWLRRLRLVRLLPSLLRASSSLVHPTASAMRKDLVVAKPRIASAEHQ